MAKQIEVTRKFNASLEMVWKVWTDPELVKQWWGPDRFISTVAEIDFREGGRSLVNMVAPKEMGNQEYFSIWVYEKIVPLKTIEFIQSLSDKEGNKLDPTKVGMPSDFPMDIRTVVIFKEADKGLTEITVTEYAEMGQTSRFAQIGLEQSLEKMAGIFSGK